MDDTDERERLIDIIESLFPADADYPDTAEIGRELLRRAKEADWRNEPTGILAVYARLCQEEERRQAMPRPRRY